MMKSTPLLEYIKARREFIAAQRNALNIEERALDAAEETINSASQITISPPNSKISYQENKRIFTDIRSLDFSVFNKKKERNKEEKTIQGKILGVLEGQPKGLTAHEILGLIAEKYGVHYKRESLSPQLSRLKKDGKVHRNESNMWSKIVQMSIFE